MRAPYRLTIVLAGVLACTDRHPTFPAINAAPGGGGDPTVTATDPDSAPRDVTLDVAVLGSGFDQGSEARWARAGVPVPQITTNSTRFVSSKKLIANITIAADADTGLYDVIVTTSTGKKGIGTESFTVTEKFPTITTFRDAPSDNIRSDREVRSDAQYTGPSYIDGICGVQSDLGNFQDARLSPAAGYKGKSMQRECGAARELIFEFDQPHDGGAPKPSRIDPIFMNIDHVLTVFGTNELRHGQFNLCGRLIFNPDDPWIPNNGSDLLLVSFDNKGTADKSDDEWTVRTQDPPNDKGYCEFEGRLWHMPFQLTIRRK